LSKKLRGRAAAPGPGIARTTAPRPAASANTLKSEPAKTAVTSAFTMGMRRSGLSEPYFVIASA
jgi:hypothetical protein